MKEAEYPRNRSLWLKKTVFPIFFASGLCALSYEIVWARQMALIFGVSIYGVSAVLGAFMAGLSLGSLLIGRLADKVSKPLRLYGMLEAGVGLFALLLPWILKNLTLPLFLGAADLFETGTIQIQATRFIIAFATLIIPSTLMGGTFPVMARFFARKFSSVGRALSILYALNTAGAVLGILLVGFVSLAFLGIAATLYAAATLNLVLAGASFLLSQWEEPWRKEAVPVARPPFARASRPSGTLSLCLAAAFLCGFISLACEVLWSRVLMFYLHNSIYAFSAMLSTFLAGIAAGSAIMSLFADRIRRPLKGIGILTVFLGLFLFLSLGTIQALPELISWGLRIFGLASWGTALIYLFVQTGLVMLAPALILGALFPLVVRTAVPSLERLGRKAGGIYSINTLGALAGSFIAGFFLIPVLGVRNSFLVLVTLCLCAGSVLWSAPSDWGLSRKLLCLSAGIGAAMGSWFLLPGKIFYSSYERRFGELLYYREEAADTVIVVQEKGRPETRMLVFSDGRGTAGIPTVAEDRFYGHLPMLLHPDPEDVLVICFGVGNTAGAIGRHPVQRIDCVELSPAVVECSKYFPANHQILEDPRVSLAIEDGRNFLLTTERLYDVIHLDPPELHTAGVVSLYTREFYQSCRRRLKKGGILSHWVNVLLLPEEELRIVVRTFQEAFPHTSVWQGPNRYSWNLIGWDHPLRIDLKAFREKMEQERVKRDLEEIGLGSVYDFLSLFLFSERGLRGFAGKGPLVTDNHSRVDFSVPRSIYSGFGFSHPFSAHEGAFDLTRGRHSRKARGGRLNMLLLSLVRETVAPFVVKRGAPSSGSGDPFEAALSRAIAERKRGYRKMISRDPDHWILKEWGATLPVE